MTSINPLNNRRPLPPVYLPSDPYADDATAEAERQALPPHFKRQEPEPAPDGQPQPDGQAARKARAEALVQWVKPLGDGRYSVPSGKSEGVRYLVSQLSTGQLLCSCADFAAHLDTPAFRCKHAWAVVRHLERQPSPTAPESGAGLLPAEGEAVVAPEPVADVTEAYRAMDTLDESAILQELEGGVVREYVYRFRLSSGQPVDGLSWPGQKAVARELQRRGLLGPIAMRLVKCEDTGAELVAIVEAKDTQSGASYLGAKAQAKRQRSREGKETEDKDALSKVISKAQRNALRNFLPEQLVLAAINKFLAEQR